LLEKYVGDFRLAVSRDSRAYSFVSDEPMIRLGAAGEWDGGALDAQPTLVQLPDGRLAPPYDAYNTTHNEILFENIYEKYDARAGIAWALSTRTVHDELRFLSGRTDRH